MGIWGAITQKIEQHVIFTCLFAVFVFALAIRLIGIDSHSIWYDEAWTMWFSRSSLTDLLNAHAKSETNPTLYYIIAKGWMAVFGETIVSLRALSAVAGALTVFPIFVIGRSIVDGRKGTEIGLLSALLFALCFEQIHIGQDGRTYAVETLSIATFLAATCMFVKNQMMDPAIARHWALYPVILGVSGAVATWSHFGAIIYMFAVGCGLLFWWGLEKKWDPRVLRAFAMAAVTYFLIAFWPLYTLSNFAINARSVDWIEAPGLKDVLQVGTITFGAAFGTPSWPLDLVLRILLFAIWPILGLWALYHASDARKRWCGILICLGSFGAFALFLLVSWLGKPLFLLRTVSPSQVGWIMLCAIGVSCLNMKTWPKSLFDRVLNSVGAKPVRIDPATTERWSKRARFYLVAVFAIGAVSFHAVDPKVFPTEEWEDLVSELHTEADPGDTIGVFGVVEVAATYLLEQLPDKQLKLHQIPRPLQIPDFSNWDGTKENFPAREVRFPEKMESLEALLENEELDWVIFRDLGQMAQVKDVVRKYGHDGEFIERDHLKALRLN